MYNKIVWVINKCFFNEFYIVIILNNLIILIGYNIFINFVNLLMMIYCVKLKIWLEKLYRLFNIINFYDEFKNFKILKSVILLSYMNIVIYVCKICIK